MRTRGFRAPSVLPFVAIEVEIRAFVGEPTPSKAGFT
jgi:hypothetical protein